MNLRLVPWVFLLSLGVAWAVAVFALAMLVAPVKAGSPTEMVPQVVVVVERARRWTADDVHQALRTASPLARCVVAHEIGGVGYEPYSVSRTNDLGPVQLNPQGLLREFLRENDDPFSPYQSIAFLDEKISEGRGGNWMPIRLGLCV